jgi:hypothetical protein
MCRLSDILWFVYMYSSAQELFNRRYISYFCKAVPKYLKKQFKERKIYFCLWFQRVPSMVTWVEHGSGSVWQWWLFTSWWAGSRQKKKGMGDQIQPSEEHLAWPTSSRQAVPPKVSTISQNSHTTTGGFSFLCELF